MAPRHRTHFLPYDYYVTSVRKSTLFWYTIAGYGVLNDNESHTTSKPGFKESTLHLWAPRVHYFPEDTTYEVLFKEMVSINY
jgi:hypothetical protein